MEMKWDVFLFALADLRCFLMLVQYCAVSLVFISIESVFFLKRIESVFENLMGVGAT